MTSATYISVKMSRDDKITKIVKTMVFGYF